MASWNVGPTEAPVGLPAGVAASVAVGVSVEIACATRTARRDAPRRPAALEVGAACFGIQAPARLAATEVALLALPRARRAAPGAANP